MFGIAVANLDNLTDVEKKRYQSLYCGLCFMLKRLYGQTSRAALSYDLAFLCMLYDSLYEPKEKLEYSHCVAHPRKKIPSAISEFTPYCADLSIALAYHKCLDDVFDDNSKRARVARIALANSYQKAVKRIPEQCEMISVAMDTIRKIENDRSSTLDEASIAFGELLGFLFETCPVCYPDNFSQDLRSFGAALGRFIYLMDAAIDFRHDERLGSYNPFVLLEHSHNKTVPNALIMRDILSVLIGQACQIFERLPLLQDASLMRSVLYSGVWQEFNKEYEKSDPRIYKTDKQDQKISNVNV